MSCNGCRVLRKGCSESCILRPCLQWIESPEAQGHATVFVAKFFGRAGLMSFISAVPETQRPALFQSLLFEACGRTVNPVNGAVGLLSTGNWHICQAAAETVLRGGALSPIPELLLPGRGGTGGSPSDEEASEICADIWRLRRQEAGSHHHCRFSSSRSKSAPAAAAAAAAKRKRLSSSQDGAAANLDLRLDNGFQAVTAAAAATAENNRPGTPSMNSEESVTTSCWETGFGEQYGNGGERKLLNLFG